MSTLDLLQRLSDGQFHQLGDDLLRRLEPQYRRLRTHGLNERGESIIGQPDSYVGATATSCAIAVCYTVERAGWWRKVVEDVTNAVAASPSIAEVVAVIPHNADRDGPKDKAIDWVSDAKAAAGSATFRLIDGRDIAAQLDNHHQDLRYHHLGIPYSRLNATSILTSAQQVISRTLEAVKSSGRYDPSRYAPRSADQELYRVWQRCLRDDQNSERLGIPAKMIALVNDSGVGKTSLVCAFAESIAKCLPVVLVQARDLAFEREDALVAHVVHTLQGVLDPHVRVGEEAAIARQLPDSTPLTLIVDGLDESRVPDAVRRAISHWLNSQLGGASILIATSRSEFWKTCSDPHWGRWMPKNILDERLPTTVTTRSAVEPVDPDSSLRLPDRFTEAELENAWTQAGRRRAELYALSAEAREELRHPFTTRVYLDLCTGEADPPPIVTQTGLMERWLNRRLDAEASTTTRITRELFQQALQKIATKIDGAGGGVVSVDDLAGVPRFDSAAPPGPVVERLIAASILESVPGRADHIRFAIEAVQDFYRAEADVEDIKADPTASANRLATLRFTDAYPRLVRIGRRLAAADGGRHPFVEQLLEADARMAAVIVAAAPSWYAPDVRAAVAQRLGADINVRHRVRAALAITLLGELDCMEAVDVLAEYLLPPADPHRYLKALGATAFVKRGHAAAADFVYRWERFGVDQDTDTYYYREQLAMLRRATPAFRSALAEQAFAHLGAGSGDIEHVWAVYVLASLGDDRLASHLKGRLNENGLLSHYENHALIALGTDAAGAVFAESVMTVGKRLADIPNDHANNERRNDLIWPVHVLSADVRYLITPALEAHLRALIECDNVDVSWIASDLVKRAHAVALFYETALAAARWSKYLDLPRYRERSAVTVDHWLTWWHKTSDQAVRKTLLGIAPLCPSFEVEKILLGCLDELELSPLAARLLGEYGSVRSASRLHQVMLEEGEDETRWSKMEAARALGDLRDHAAVPLLKAMGADESDRSLASPYAVSSLGIVGTPEAEEALVELLADGAREDIVIPALVVCGSRSAVEAVVARAKARHDGPAWLCKQISRMSFLRGWTRGRYYTHVQSKALVEYLEAEYETGDPEADWDAVRALEQIDGSEVRRLLRTWANRHGTPADPVVRNNDRLRLSGLCIRELIDRGDAFAIPYVLEQRPDDRDDIYVTFVAEDLRHCPSQEVAAEIRRRLSAAATNSWTVRMLSLLGKFGDPSDAEIVRPFLDHADDLVANIACEALLRLTDPVLVPRGWREL